MVRRFNRRWALVAGVLLTVVSIACVQLSPTLVPGPIGGVTVDTPAQDDAALALATAVAVGTDQSLTLTPTPPAGRQVVAVRRGPIAELLPLSGRVASLDETPITYPGLGRVDTVAVKPGDEVTEGQLLVQAETKEIDRDLTAARSRVQLGALRLEQSNTQAQARQRQAEQRLEADRARRQQAMADADAGLRRAQQDFERVKAGAPAADRRAAEAGVVSARTALERARAELARASAGPTDAELKAADQQVWSARIALHRAEMDFQALKNGPNPTDLRTAERDVSSAQTALDRARADLERLIRGDPQAIAAADRQVQSAEAALRAARAMPVSGGSGRGSKDAERSARASRDAAVTNAQLALQDAQERLRVARQGPAPIDVQTAQRAIHDAEVALQTAQERYDKVRQGPDELTLATANQAVQTAQVAAQQAEARYLEISAGPPADRIAASQDGVNNAQASLASAMDRLAQINSHPTAAELSDAQDRVNAAQVALARAQSEPEPEQDDGDNGAYDRMVLEKSLEQDRSQVATLEGELAATRVLAPFAGVVTAVQVRQGDPLDRGLQLLTLAKPGDRIVLSDLSSDDAPRVAIGQGATVQVDGGTGDPWDATVTAIVDAPSGIGKLAQLRVDWRGAPAMYGASIQTIVTLNQKADALLVPQRAVRSSGSRRIVEIMDGNIRRTVDVTQGIVGAVDVEILSGLSEGQVVTLPTTGSASGTSAASGSGSPPATPPPRTTP
jgi:HlyD family secretion protein